MIPRDCKRLAEVDFPVSAVSKHAAREKSIRHGHPSTLHLWWARRPLASSRAVLLALLLPDPCDPHCPDAFKREATGILGAVRQPPADDAELRKALLWFIGAFANWDMAAHQTYLNVGRNLVRAAHGAETPLVVDPFAGGGSIPLEALRLGCEAFASDLNPVACLILKVMLEDIPRHGPGLADELRRAGAEVKEAAERELADLYPPDPDGATPIAYLWARTARCEAPNCGAEIPLMRSFWLCKKAKRKRALRYRVQRPSCGTPCVEFEVFEPRADKEVPDGTVTRARATCLCCGAVLPPERVRAQLAAEGGGADVVFNEAGRRVGGARLTAVVTLKPDATGRHYRPPTQADYAAVGSAHERIARVRAEWEHGGEQGMHPVPDEPLPPIGTLGFRVQRYGMHCWGDLFTARQKLALLFLARLCNTFPDEQTRRCLGLSLSGVADRNVSLATWRPQADQEKVEHLFARHALPMAWDFGEAVPPSDSTGSIGDRLNILDKTISAMAGDGKVPHGTNFTQAADATRHPLPDESAGIWFTDPPYYDAIPYSDLSDFFLVWLRRALPDQPLLRDPFDPGNPLSPKVAEAVQDETKQVDGRAKDRAWFEETMARAFAEGRRVLREDGVGSVVFAHKTTEGWEALLSGLIRGGWTITASWPIATEMGTRLRARDSAALATSVHLVCRPRAHEAPVGDWADVLRELPVRVADWMERLQGEGIRGADLVFACIGPALEIFSRYRGVETADGRTVSLAEYLEKVWEVVGRTALKTVLGAAEAGARNGLAGALEEDARLTALFLWTLQATTADGNSDTDSQDGDAPSDDADADIEKTSAAKAKGFSLVFDVVRRFAQPLGIDLQKWERRTIETKKGVVRLLPVAERSTQLFGQRGSQAVAAWLEQQATGTDPLQGLLFPGRPEGPPVAVRERPPRYGDPDRTGDRAADAADATTLDRVHTGMLLQAGGRTNALRALVQAERERGPDFLRLSNALSALYPRGSDEKRLLDAMLLAVPR